MSEINATTGPEGEPGPTKEAMPAEFGLAMAIFVVVASMVGTGVLTTSGYTVATVGSNQWMLILWVVGGVTAVCGALTLAELSAAMPRTGGDYVYLYEAYGPLPAFLSGWVSFLIGFAGPGAASGFASAKYLLAPFQDSLGMDIVLLERLVATGLILAFAAIHVLGRRQTEHVQAWITAIKLVLLVGFAAAGLYAGWPNRANLHDLTPITDERWPDGPAHVLGLHLLRLYGMECGVLHGGRGPRPPAAAAAGDPAGDRRRAAAVHGGQRHVCPGADRRPTSRRSSRTRPTRRASTPWRRSPSWPPGGCSGPYWARPLSVAVGIMLLSSLSAYLLIGPRVLYAMAEAGQFPAMAARLTRKARTPGIATALQLAVTLVLLWTGSVESLILYAGVGLSIFSMLAMSSIFVLRWKQPDLPRPFRTPGYPVTPAVYLVLTGMMTLAAFRSGPRCRSMPSLSILAGVPFYYLWRYPAGRKPAGDRSLE